MDDQLLLRYSRQIMLPEVDLEGQERLAASSVLLVGLGGLGSPLAMYLGSAGVGRMIFVDDDRVELSNLQRQIVHGSSSVDQPKVESARKRVLELNPHVAIETHETRFDEERFASVVADVDVVVDATDSFESRFAINHLCVRHAKPLVSGAAIRFEGQVSVFRPDHDGAPCYRCLYAEAAGIDGTCATNGVIAPLLGIIGSVQALEVIKVLLGIGDSLEGRLLLLDALSMEWQTMRFRRNPKCPECGDAV